MTTNQQFTTGTFDFLIPNGQFVDGRHPPAELLRADGYTPGAWTCRAGNQSRPVELIDIPDGGAWKGIESGSRANEAVSCTLAVNR